KLRRILAAAVEVDRPIFFSVMITIAAFLPLFTMQGVEGQIFGPMSRTYVYALLGAVIATFTVTPVIASLLLPERVNEVETFVVRQIREVYQFVLPLAVPITVCRRRSRWHFLQSADSSAPGWAQSFCRSSRRATFGSAG